MSSNLGKIIPIFVIGLLLGGAVVYALGTQTPSTNKSNQTKTYYIGNINDLTGPVASYGQSFQKASQLAINQINADLNASGRNIQFKLVSLDSKGTPEGALAALQTLHQTYAIQIDVGPITSSELAGLLSYANTNHILVIGPTSSADSLSIPNDYLVRPDSLPASYESQALVQLAKQSGIKNLVVVWRADTFGSGYYNATQGNVGTSIKVAGISYSPGQTDYASTVSAASSQVATAKASGKTAVLWVGLTTEIINMFTHAASDSVLTSVQWYGNSALFTPDIYPPATPALVGLALARTNFTAGSVYSVGNPVTQQFTSSYQKEYGQAPISFAETFYDGVWIAALTVLYSGTYNGTVFQRNVFTVANHFVGVDGQTYLDAKGDQGIGYVGIDQLFTNSTGGYLFKSIGHYDGSTKTLVFNATSRA